MSVMVTDAHLRFSREVVQSLGRKKIAITVAGEDGLRNSACYSKFIKNRILYPNPDREDTFTKFMLEASKGHEVLIPIHTRTIIPISKRLSEFKRIVKIPIPDYETLKIALDKSRLIRLAQGVGIPTPRTWFVDALNQLPSVCNKMSYPVVIKLRQDAFIPPPRYIYAYSPPDFLSKYRLMHNKCSYPLVQEFVPGVGYGFFALFNEKHMPVAVFCHKRLREYPITGGPSAYCESAYDGQLVTLGLRLLTSMKWYGVAMVEFRRDVRDCSFKLMEVNPRFWGSLGLPIHAGVDFPAILYDMVAGKSIKAFPKYLVNKKWRLLLKDIYSLNQGIHETPCKVECLERFISSFFDKHVSYGDADPHDLGPLAYEMGCAIVKRFKIFNRLITRNANSM